MARDCPSNALFGEEQGMLGIKHSGVVEGKAVEGIMLDTGCSRTMHGAGRFGARRKATGGQMCGGALCTWGYSGVSYGTDLPGGRWAQDQYCCGCI